MFRQTLIALLFMAGSTLSVSAETDEWSLTPDTSRLSFSGTQAGVPFEGQFERFTAEITFDPATLGTGAINVTIDTASAHSGSPERDGALPGADWFDVVTHPTASFTSTHIETGEEEGAYVANGTLTLKGHSQEVELPFTLTLEENSAHVTGALTLDRNDYGVGTGALSSMVGSTITIHININATR